MAVIHIAQLQSDDAVKIVAGMLMRPQRHHQPHWSRFHSGPLANSAEDTPKCWDSAYCLLQYLEEIGMEISLTLTPLSYDSPPTHRILEHLEEILMDQRKLLTSIGLENVETLGLPKGRSWTPLPYALRITRPATCDSHKGSRDQPPTSRHSRQNPSNDGVPTKEKN